jgi:SAM-dependent methyltransferase
MRPIEITDLIWSADLDGARRPIRVSEVTDRLLAAGQRRAARIVSRMPAEQGILDSRAVDGLFLRVHAELARLAEETQLARRVGQWLSITLAQLRQEQPGARVRVVDVGSGIGYVPRWLAARGALGPDVEFLGFDLNAPLVRRANELAEVEGLAVRFFVGDALASLEPVEPADQLVLISSGLLHHLDPAELSVFFAAHDRAAVSAFGHWDVDPGPWATLGAWVFHQARMREPVSRHDGVLSARRAHSAADLIAAAVNAGPGYTVSCVDAPRNRPRLTDILRPVIGRRIQPGRA